MRNTGVIRFNGCLSVLMIIVGKQRCQAGQEQDMPASVTTSGLMHAAPLYNGGGCIAESE